MIVWEERGYLASNLSREECNCDTIFVDIVVEGSKVHTNFLCQDVKRCASKQSRIDVYHVSIEAKIGITSHNIFFCHLCFLLIPMCIVHNTVMF